MLCIHPLFLSNCFCGYSHDILCNSFGFKVLQGNMLKIGIISLFQIMQQYFLENCLCKASRFYFKLGFISYFLYIYVIYDLIIYWFISKIFFQCQFYVLDWIINVQWNLNNTRYILLLKGKLSAQSSWQRTVLFLSTYGSKMKNIMPQCIQFFNWINIHIWCYL